MLILSTVPTQEWPHRLNPRRLPFFDDLLRTYAIRLQLDFFSGQFQRPCARLSFFCPFRATADFQLGPCPRDFRPSRDSGSNPSLFPPLFFFCERVLTRHVFASSLSRTCIIRPRERHREDRRFSVLFFFHSKIRHPSLSALPDVSIDILTFDTAIPFDSFPNFILSCIPECSSPTFLFVRDRRCNLPLSLGFTRSKSMIVLPGSLPSSLTPLPKFFPKFWQTTAVPPSHKPSEDPSVPASRRPLKFRIHALFFSPFTLLRAPWIFYSLGSERLFFFFFFVSSARFRELFGGRRRCELADLSFSGETPYPKNPNAR